MRKTRLWKCCMVAAIGFVMLSAASAVYAGEIEGNLTAEPKKLKDGDIEKDLYEITVKDNGAKRLFTVNGMTTDEPDLMPCLLAVDGSHFCATASQTVGTLLSPEKIEGMVDGSDTEILFEYEVPTGGGAGGVYLCSGLASYCDLYAKTKEGKPISGLSLEYDASQHGDIVGGTVVMIQYDENGKITKKSKLDGYGKIKTPRGRNGYTQLTGWGSHPNGMNGQIIPYMGLGAGRQVYAILDDTGVVYEDSYGEGNRYIRAFKTNESEDKFTVLAPDGSKVADVIIRCHETDYYSTSAIDFDYDYEVENLADGWEISVDMSETTAFPNSLETGDSLPCEPSLLISITAKRKKDDGLIPTFYDFDGRQNLTFRFKGIEGIKEIKKVYFNCAENVQAADGNWLGWIFYTAEDLTYDLKKGELTFPNISEAVYDRYPSVGNTYQGSMIYVAEDGTEKTAYGEWYIKVLEKSDEPKLDVKVKEIKISGLSHKIAVGKKITLKAAVTPSDVTNKSITWKSSNPKYASVNSSGIVTIKKAGAGKTVTITATARDGSEKEASYKIKCMKGAVKKVVIAGQKSRNLKVGRSIKLKTKVMASSGANKTLCWTSSNPNYAVVTSKGQITAKKAGQGKTVRITAMTTDGSNKKATVKVRIK